MVVLRFINNKTYLDEQEIDSNTYTFLDYRNITEIVGIPPPIIKYLNLRGNQLTSLFNKKGEQFNTGSIINLVLEDNRLTSLFNKKGEQFNMGSIRKVSLKNNQIASLFNEKGEQFSANNLTIFLNNNQIRSLFNKDGIQFNINGLKYLILEGNPIELLIPDYPEIKDKKDLKIYQEKLADYIRDKKVKSARK